MFAALARDWRALRQEAEEARTVPFFLPGYREAMARAAALAAVEDLPADMRRLVDGMVEEHEEHLARDREVRTLIDRIRENSDDWPELGWVASAQGCAMEELPSYGAWREEGETLLEAARETLGPGGSAGLASAVETLERTRLIDEAARFERLWRGVRQRAARDGVPELHTQGYGEAAELGATLAASEGLDRRQRGVLDEWREIHAEQTALAEAVHTLPARVAAWEKRRNDLPLDGRGGIDPADPACAAWREDGARLGLAGAAMLSPGDAHAPYLDAVPGAAAAVERSAEVVRDALAEHRYAEFAWLARELNRRSKETGIERFHLPRYADTIAAAQLLSARVGAGPASRLGGRDRPGAGEGMTEERREAVDSWLRYDETHARLRVEIRDWPGRADALAAECPERPARLDALTGWRRRAEALRGEAVAMHAEKSPHAPHLAAMPKDREALDAAVRALDRTVAAVEVREMDLLATRAQREARKAGGIAYDAPAWPELMARVRALDARPDLAEGPRRKVNGHLARDRRWKADRERVGAFLDRADGVLRARGRLAETAAREAAPEWERWKRNADGIAAVAAALSADLPQPELAAHLIALGAEADGVDRKREDIRQRIARDEAARAAAVEAERRERERIAEETARAAEEARTAAEEENRRRVRDRERVAAFLERAPAVENGWIQAEFGMLASPEAERAAARQGWLKDARELRGEADAIERDIPEAELEDHLRALGAPPGAVANRKAAIGPGIGVVERALAGERAERARPARDRRQPAPAPSPEPGETPAEPLRETMERALAARAGGVTMVLAGHVPDADRDSVYRRLDGLRTAVPAIRLLLGDAPGFERIAADWARDRGVEHFVFRAPPEAGPDAARDRDRAIVEARPAGVMVFSDGREPAFLARHAEEHGIPVSILPTADLVRTAAQSIEREREARETQDRTIRKGPSMGF